MNDGFKSGHGVELTCECFTEHEVDIFKLILENKFGLIVTKMDEKLNILIKGIDYLLVLNLETNYIL